VLVIPSKLLLAALAVVALVVAVSGFVLTRGDDSTKVTAHFTSAVALYEGSSVRVLGVDVGTVDAVRPEGETVRVDMTIEEGVQIPADAGAVIIPPSLVSDRFVQFTPAYTDGPVLASGTVLPVERTRTPVELDEILRSLDEVLETIGPDGANSEGALNDLISVSADNLDGNGERINSTISDVSRAVQALNNNSGDLVAVIRNLGDFSTTLAASDAQVRSFNAELVQAADFLSSEREQLAQVMATLSVALEEVASFVRDNRDVLVRDFERLVEITQLFDDNRAALGEFLDTSALAFGNFGEVVTETADGRFIWDVRGQTEQNEEQLLGQLAGAALPAELAGLCNLLTMGSPSCGTAPPATGPDGGDEGLPPLPSSAFSSDPPPQEQSGQDDSSDLGMADLLGGPR
jgi:phospholipid/cholesterol/gamma-HCH transport system substrate-binding protein